MINSAIKNFINDPGLMSNVGFIVLRFTNKLQSFQEKFKIFKNLQEGEKIGQNEIGEYWVYGNNYWQQISRYYYNEDRKSTIKQITDDFTEFFKFLDQFEDEYIHNNIVGRFIILKRNICDFIDDIIPGLYNLKNTYKDYKPMELKVDSIILTMLEFKEKINKMVHENNNINLINANTYSVSI